MHFSTSTFVLGALAVVSSVAASPILSPRQEGPYSNNTQEFYLKSCLTNGSTDATKEGLYLAGYHTGAGLSDATFLDDTADAAKGFLNETYLEFDFGQDGEYPWGFSFFGDTNYAAWDPVEINTGFGTGGFAIQDGKLVWDDAEFAGWLSCDWFHGVPQLFYQVTYYVGTYVPPSCSNIDLIVEYI